MAAITMKFENHSLEQDRQTLAINEFDIHSSSRLSSEKNYKDSNDKFFQDNGLVNSIGCCGQDNGNFLTYQLNDTSSMANFDML